MPLQLEIVTPEASIYADEVDTVVLPGCEGEMGVLPHHAPLVTLLSAGELRIVKGGKTHFMAVGEGLVEVTGSSTRILTDAAIGEDAIDEGAVQAALDRAQARLKDTASLSAEEIAATEASILHSLAQLKVKRRRISI
jgi:F-type H+-transporting ATPase subunit epsilon